MLRLKEPRKGEVARKNSREVNFSFWPSFKKEKHFTLQAPLFVSDPWSAINDAMKNRATIKRATEALAYSDQAKEFLRASQNSRSYAKPLLSSLVFGKAARGG